MHDFGLTEEQLASVAVVQRVGRPRNPRAKFRCMKSVAAREVRNHGGDVLDPVARGETLVVTRDGTDVVELRPRTRRSPSPADAS